MKKLTPELKNLLKISKELVVLVVVINHKFLSSKSLQEKNFLKEANARIVIVHLYEIQHDLIQTRKVIY